MHLTMKAPLKEIAEIRAGHPFRGAIKESEDGNGYVIQIRDQDENGLIDWGQLARTQVTGRKEPEWLKPGDIVFAARGMRNLASVVSESDIAGLGTNVISSPHYFQIRIRQGSGLLPEFLAWQLNQGVSQRHFQQSALGSAQVSIRRSVLEQTFIIIPPVDKQNQIVRLADCARREKQIYERLIELRKLELEETARKILNN